MIETDSAKSDRRGGTIALERSDVDRYDRSTGDPIGYNRQQHNLYTARNLLYKQV
jgi:hypothetical protein